MQKYKIHLDNRQGQMNTPVEKILKFCGIKPKIISEPQMGYRNRSYPIVTLDNQKLNLILYKNEPGILDKIKNANSVSNYLNSLGMPTRLSIGRIIKANTPHNTRFASVYNYLPGHTIPWDSYTMDRIKHLGQSMGDMHFNLQSYDTKKLDNVVDECLKLNQRLIHYLEDPSVTRALSEKLNIQPKNYDFLKIIAASKRLSPQIALHLDFVRGNILFDDNSIVGILDFEKTAKGHVIFDIARTLAFLLVDCKFKDETKIRKYFLHSGYNKRSKSKFKKLRIGDIDILEELISFYLVYDFYKFLRHNPYESLPQNEHFIRTVQILQKRDIIS